MAHVNPIASVNGVSIPSPAAMTYIQSDVSSSDAGRTEDSLMHKKRIRSVVSLQLSWSYLDTATAGEVLRAFQPEYFSVNYLDPVAGGFTTKTFYVGDRSVPQYNATIGLWENVSFNIIER